jgi:hypothetical protein
MMEGIIHRRELFGLKARKGLFSPRDIAPGCSMVSYTGQTWALGRFYGGAE